MDILFVFIYGIVIGSFLNVCIYRIPRNESLVNPPSHCTSCGKRVKWYDLFPVVGFLILRGKCRYCGEKISIRYPLIELWTGFIYILIYMNFGFSLEFFKYVVLASFLIVIGIIDLDTTDVYLKTTLPGIIAGIIFAGYGYYLYGGIWECILGGALGGGVLSLIILLTKGMGWGDAEICLMCGLFLGLKLTVIMLFLSFVIGGITGISLILFKKKSRRDYIPFGPFISLAASITILFGERIFTWYISLI